MKKYLLYTPKYDENVGGVIAMHKLCHLLNLAGQKAFLWKYEEDNTFLINSSFITPTLYTEDLDKFIVVYMEIIAGNPLNAPNVIRWFLNKPGFFTEEIKYGKNELYFYFQKVFNDIEINTDVDNQLYVTHFMDDQYKQINFAKRRGSCYIVRKGKDRKIVHDLLESIQIDGLSHKEIAAIFNEREYFYSYDLYTAYTFFAIMCGCIPIVVPEENISMEQWHSDEYLRYGIAYGENDIEYVYKTKHKIFETLQILEDKAKVNVEKFIRKSQEFFKTTYKTKEIIEEEKLEYLKSLNNTRNKIVFFGVSESLRTNFYMLKNNGIVPDYLCDNSALKQGSYFEGKLVYDPQELFDINETFDVLITSSFVNEIKKQLECYQNIKAIYSIYG